METVKVSAVADMPTSINLGKFWIVHCVLDGNKHPGHLHRRRSINMITGKGLLVRCGLGSLVSFHAKM